MKFKIMLAVASSLPTFAAYGCAADDTLGNQTSPAPARTYSYDVNDQCYYTSDCYTVQVGSDEIDPSRLSPYHAIWTQDVPEGGEWVRSPGTFEETLSTGADGNWKHVQIIRPGNGGVNTGTRILDSATLQALSLTLEFEGGPPQQPTKVYYDLTSSKFIADVTMADGTMVQGQPREMAMPMFDGQIGGLTIAALPLREGYSATLPMVIPNLGIYWIEASVVGKKTIPAANGASVAVWEVNANWLNLSDGDIYEPGRDGDGGVYYIAVTPGDGVPPVVEYVNKTGIIAWDGVRRNK